MHFRDSSGVSHAVQRIEAGPKHLRTTIDRLEERLRCPLFPA